MPQEIERKFLVEELPSNLENYQSEKISQGYIVITDAIEVRIRRKGTRFYQTIKSSGDLIRDEIEIEINENQFNKLWPLTEGKRIEKIRYKIEYKKNLIEFDVYCGSLDGLLTAEVEFKSEVVSNNFQPPNWFGIEVTSDQRYKNKNLSLSGIPK